MQNQRQNESTWKTITTFSLCSRHIHVLLLGGCGKHLDVQQVILMKGEVIEITKVVDPMFNITYQVAIMFEEVPDLKVGSAEVTQ